MSALFKGLGSAQRLRLNRAAVGFTVPTRGMAADAKSLLARLKVVENIQKITKAMKMVAAAKLSGVQRNLNAVRDFQDSLTRVWPAPTEAPAIKSRALVMLTSDKGLCGSLNSGLLRKWKKVLLETNVQGKAMPYSIVLLGKKGQSSLERLYGKNFVFAYTEYAKPKVLPFRQVAVLADTILKTPFDEFNFQYNRFKNLMTTIQTEEKMYSTTLALANAGVVKSKYTVESGGYSDVLRDLYEFRFAVRIWHMFAENMTSEMSSRMNAMSNSSKAAQEMAASLQLQYNRTRQAKITTELIEIVSGAAALDDDKANN